MKRSILLPFLVFYLLSYGQRSERTRYSSLSPTVEKSSSQSLPSGHYFNMLLTNKNSIPLLLKLGPTKQIAHNDTLILARIYSCNNPAIGQSYDLDYTGGWESSCVRWYTYQFIKPGDTIRFTVKLSDFTEADSVRLYYCFTNEITNTDKGLYADPTRIYITKDNGRDFKAKYINLIKTKLNIALLQLE